MSTLVSALLIFFFTVSAETQRPSVTWSCHLAKTAYNQAGCPCPYTDTKTFVLSNGTDPEDQILCSHVLDEYQQHCCNGGNQITLRFGFQSVHDALTIFPSLDDLRQSKITQSAWDAVPDTLRSALPESVLRTVSEGLVSTPFSLNCRCKVPSDCHTQRDFGTTGAFWCQTQFCGEWSFFRGHWKYCSQDEVTDPGKVTVPYYGLSCPEGYTATNKACMPCTTGVCDSRWWNAPIKFLFCNEDNAKKPQITCTKGGDTYIAAAADCVGGCTSGYADYNAPTYDDSCVCEDPCPPGLFYNKPAVPCPTWWDRLWGDNSIRGDCAVVPTTNTLGQDAVQLQSLYTVTGDCKLDFSANCIPDDPAPDCIEGDTDLYGQQQIDCIYFNLLTGPSTYGCRNKRTCADASAFQVFQLYQPPEKSEYPLQETFYCSAFVLNTGGYTSFDSATQRCSELITCIAIAPNSFPEDCEQFRLDTTNRFRLCQTIAINPKPSEQPRCLWRKSKTFCNGIFKQQSEDYRNEHYYTSLTPAFPICEWGDQPGEEWLPYYFNGSSCLPF